MRNLFNANNPFFRLLSTLFDLMVLNILTLLCSLPVVTIGASLTAAHRVMGDVARDESSGIVQPFFSAFRDNFKQATVAWLIAFVVLSALVCDFILLRLFCDGMLYTVLLILLALLAIICLSILAYLFPLIGRYQNTLREHVRNAMILCIVNFPRTFLMVALHLLPLMLFFLLPYAFLYTLLFWLIMGVAVLVMADAYLLKPIHAKLEA